MFLQRFVNESKLQLANNEDIADAVINGKIIATVIDPLVLVGTLSNQNQVQITVSASFQYKTDNTPLWAGFNGGLLSIQVRILLKVKKTQRMMLSNKLLIICLMML